MRSRTDNDNRDFPARASEADIYSSLRERLFSSPAMELEEIFDDRARKRVGEVISKAVARSVGSPR